MAINAMFKKNIYYLFSLFLVIASIKVEADEDLDDLRYNAAKNQWILVKEDKLRNIKAWTKLEDTSTRGLRSFKIEATMDASMLSIAQTITDVERIQSYFWECLDSKMLKIVSEDEYYFYLKINTPKPLKDRDIVLRAKVEPYSKKRGYLKFDFKAVPDFMPPVAGLIRVPEYTFYVKLTPIDDKRVRFDMEGVVDPGGQEPVWAVNFIQRRAPYTSIVGLLRHAQLGQYKVNSAIKLIE